MFIIFSNLFHILLCFLSRTMVFGIKEQQKRKKTGICKCTKTKPKPSKKKKELSNYTNLSLTKQN